MLTQAEVKRLFDYDYETGNLAWRIKRERSNIGSIAGTAHSGGYLTVSILNKKYYSHRIIWFWNFGKWPTEIDHINGIRDDNRICNLREVTRSENCQNQRRGQKNGKTGILGVCYCNRNKKYQANIKADGKNLFLGYFLSSNMAHAAYLDAKRRLHSACTI